MTKITIDRSVVEQTLEALERLQNAIYNIGGEHVTGLFVANAAADSAEKPMGTLRTALAQPAPEPETCTWHQDGDSDSGLYGTSCGRYFNLEDGTPEDNRMQWCCYCGKKLVQELITENSDE